MSPPTPTRATLLRYSLPRLSPSSPPPVTGSMFSWLHRRPLDLVVPSLLHPPSPLATLDLTPPLLTLPNHPPPPPIGLATVLPPYTHFWHYQYGGQPWTSPFKSCNHGFSSNPIAQNPNPSTNRWLVESKEVARGGNSVEKDDIIRDEVLASLSFNSSPLCFWLFLLQHRLAI